MEKRLRLQNIIEPATVVPSSSIIFPSGCHCDEHVSGPSYVDDYAGCIADRDSRVMLSKLKEAARVIIDTCCEHLLIPNIEEN